MDSVVAASAVPFWERNDGTDEANGEETGTLIFLVLFLYFRVTKMAGITNESEKPAARV